VFLAGRQASPVERGELLAAIRERWEEETRVEYLCWFALQHSSGRTYYSHRQTGETMWEHPASVVLPPHYMRVRSLELLRSEVQMRDLSSRYQQPAGTDVRIDCGSGAVEQLAIPASPVEPASPLGSTSAVTQVSLRARSFSHARDRAEPRCPTTCAQELFGERAAVGRAEYFDMSADDDTFEYVDCTSIPPKADVLCQWYEVY
jgi:hypothetical protein